MYYTKRWAFETCQSFFGLSNAQAEQVCGEEGRHLLQALWDDHPQAFYDHPLSLLRQEWWHMMSGQYRHDGFWWALPAGACVLDYGCGAGAVCLPWIVQGGRATLYDPSRNARRYLRHKYGAWMGRGCTVVDQELILDHAMTEGHGPPFDALVCTDVLEHVPDPLALQAYLWTVLKPGGQALLKMETAYPHPGHLAEAVAQFPAWKRWIQRETAIIELETYAWVRKPLAEGAHAYAG